MNIAVDTTSPVPPYEQVRGQIAELAVNGALAPGTRLPTIRQLSGDLGLAPGTVARAYRELEAAGVVVSRVRHGTTIARRRALSEAQRRARLVEAAAIYAAVARSLGADRDDAIAVVESQLAAPTRP
jgi:GntR family transcriptional regulator